MAEPSTAFKRDQVVKIISSVISKVESSEMISRDMLYRELRDLHQIIEDARREIGLSRPGEICNKHIPSATDELDAVVAATAEATGTIMDCCEAIEGGCAGLDPAQAEPISGAVMKIYEACSFQDITGQRITKVVRTLKEIDAKVDSLLSLLGADKLANGEGESDSRAPQGDAALLNGPQLPGAGISQSDIDKLLAEFD
ncbi:MAG TPA: protein phosphatase CheZ [Alphaproteobacteria bacterium]|nr:protein phosphatase CheZ [Alphaproteobacteria bacterium]